MFYFREENPVNNGACHLPHIRYKIENIQIRMFPL